MGNERRTRRQSRERGLTPEAEDVVGPLGAGAGLGLGLGGPGPAPLARSPELKRSAWSAGMAAAPVPIPGSPAAWQLGEPGGVTAGSHGAGPGGHPGGHPGGYAGGLPPPPSLGDSFPSLGPPSAPFSRPRSPIPQINVAPGSPTRSPVLRPASPGRSPFNFEPTFVSASPARPSQRRGHRYKHSSVSMNFFQEPAARAPLAIPVSLAVPTLREAWQSVTREQAAQLGFCGLRVLATLLLFAADTRALHAVAALAHWVAYDTVVALTLACVDVLANFDVWRRSSLRLPFALQRTEVLAGFALAVTLMFIGFDTVSHTVQDAAQAFYGGTGTHGHGHGHGGHEDVHADDGSLDHAAAAAAARTRRALVRVALALVLTIVSLVPAGLANAWTTNRISCVTALFCALVLALPALGPLRGAVDELLTPAMAAAMLYFGWQAAKQFGGMLVMSHDGPDRSAEVADAIAAEASVAAVSDVSLWRVHHDLWLASMKIHMTGSDADERRVRDAAAAAVRRIVGDEPGVRWETTVDISRTTLD